MPDGVRVTAGGGGGGAIGVAAVDAVRLGDEHPARSDRGKRRKRRFKPHSFADLKMVWFDSSNDIE